MKKLFVLLILLASVCPASAEIKILNATGMDLKVDVLHKAGPVRDVAVSKEMALSEAIGPVSSRRTREMLVVKSADGTELLRTKVDSQTIYVIEKRSSGYAASYAGFFKGKAEHSTLKLMNATGQKLAYSYETPEFRVKKNKLDFRTLRAWNIGSENSYKIGDVMDVKLGIDTPTQSFKLKAGTIYLVTLEGSTIKTQAIGLD